jgi:hypothetical protein
MIDTDVKIGHSVKIPVHKIWYYDITYDTWLSMNGD